AGAIGSNQLVAGEAYDARNEKPNWNKVGYDDRQWSNAAVRPAPEGGLRSQPVPSMKVQDTFKPTKMTKHADGGWLFEFDRYFSGWVRLKVKGKAGAKITIHYELGEKDTYILKGDPEGETYEPRFTIHPVRYVRVEGLAGVPTLDTVQGREVYSDVDMHGHFTCSNDLLNQIHGNIQRTLKVALKGFVLDCLHREPIFYNEPASYFGSLSARKYIPNLWTDVARSIPLAGSENGDLSDIVPRLPGMNRQSDVSQNAAYPMLVWYLYQCHGDERLLEQHYDSVKAWVDFIGREMAGDNHIVTKGWLGEHMLPGRETGHWEFISKETPKDFIWTCFYYHNTRTLANMCRVLGKKEEEERYAKLAQEIRAVINKTWLDSKTGHYATKSQTSEILPLALDIVPQENKKQLIENIAKTITQSDGGKLRVGHVGLPGFMESLVQNGLGEIVYDAVNHSEFPGWGYMIDQGATTVWESWGMLKGGYKAEESMTMLAGVGRFFYESIAGIQEPPYYGTREFGPGYGHFHIKPHALGNLKHAEASIKTVRGIISSSWKRTKNSFVLEIEIPVGSTAKVSVPTLGLNELAITEGGKAIWKNDSFIDGVAGVADARRDADGVTFNVGSGRYCFELSGARSHRP
ncbi:glycoside hydrolase family 78 protein, partial [Mariniblastus sp.]|nr:glycoside hydrolase family 78 protein [Mariniblastus sp.]